MRLRTTLTLLSLIALITGCQNINPTALISTGSQMIKAATLSDQQVRTYSDQSCAAMDEKNQIAPANSSYIKRLNKIAAALGNNVDGIQAHYKVYISNEANAWAMANGCIRVYTGLMDMMTDNEIESILGHEIGHIVLGHSRKAMQVAYTASAARSAIGSVGGVATQLSNSQMANLGEKLINAQFSQSQESDADAYAYKLLKQRNLNPQGLVTAFQKLASHEQQSQGIFASHPPSKKRADKIKQMIAADKS